MFSTFVYGVLALIGMAMVFMVIVSLFPYDNPLRYLLNALVKRMAATGALMFIDVPALAVPVGGEIFDLGTVLFLGYYWYTFFRDMRLALPSAPPLPPQWHEIEDSKQQRLR